MKVETADFHKAIAEGRREEREAVKTFVQGVERGDLELFPLGWTPSPRRSLSPAKARGQFELLS